MSLEYVGPFERWSVVVDGWEVPHLDMMPMTGGKVSISLDRRFGLELTVADAELVLPFVAHAIAIAGGWACHPSDDDEPTRLSTIRPRRLIPLPAPKPERELLVDNEGADFDD